jgi:hypothetical protein
MSKSELAERILRLAAQGERDPIRLRTRAVIEVMNRQVASAGDGWRGHHANASTHQESDL